MNQQSSVKPPDINLVVSHINHESLDQLTIFFMATRNDMKMLAENTTGPLQEQIVRILNETKNIGD